MSDQQTLPFDSVAGAVVDTAAAPRVAQEVADPETDTCDVSGVTSPHNVEPRDGAEAYEPAEPAEPSGSSEPTAGSPLEVRIVRSKRRKKSVGAHIVNGVVEVIVPTWMSKADAERHAEQMRVRFERKSGKSHLDLVERARTLAATYDLPKPISVRWVTNQHTRWGSCTPADASIRLSDRLKSMPQWVVDYVLVHELAHLRHPDHSAAFWAAVNVYPKTERARGFLIGISYAEGTDATDH